MNHRSHNDNLNWSNAMNLMQENLARAHMESRLREARELRRGAQLNLARRMARKAAAAGAKARPVLARVQ